MLMFRKDSTTSPEHHPLFREEYRHKLFIFEDSVASGVLTRTAFNFLSGAYQSLVQYFDRTGDPVKEYFVHKMQNLLAQAVVVLKDPIEPPSPRNFGLLDDFEGHQLMKLKKLDFDLSLGQRKDSERRATVQGLISGHQLATNKFENYIASQATEQERQFERKMDERKHRSVSKSLANLSLHKVLPPGAPSNMLAAAKVRGPPDWRLKPVS